MQNWRADLIIIKKANKEEVSAKNENNVHFLRVNIVINKRLKIIVESKKDIE